MSKPPRSMVTVFIMNDGRYVKEHEFDRLNDQLADKEKQLAEARAEIERLSLELENKQYTITCASEENQQLKESLAEARAEIEKQDTLLEKCLSLLKQQKEKEEL